MGGIDLAGWSIVELHNDIYFICFSHNLHPEALNCVVIDSKILESDLKRPPGICSSHPGSSLVLWQQPVHLSIGGDFFSSPEPLSPLLTKQSIFFFFKKKY